MVKKWIQCMVKIPKFGFGTEIKEGDNKEDLKRRLKMECITSLIIQLGEQSQGNVKEMFSFFKFDEFDENE